MQKWVRMPDIWNSIGTWSPGIAFGMACLWFLNFTATKYLEEKGEWNDALERLLNRYDNRVIESTTALVNAANQDHQLRGKLTEDMTRRESQYTTITDLLRGIDNRLRLSGLDSRAGGNSD